MYDTNDHLMYYITPWQLVQQTIGPASASVGTLFQENERSRLIRQEFDQNSEEIVNAIVDGKTGKAFKLMNKYGIVPTSKSIKNEYLRRNIPRETRDLMEGQMKLKQYEQRRK